MRESFAAEVHAVVVRAAEEEAGATGSPTLEAEHLLLALTSRRGDPATELLARSGLDHEGILAALDRETERSLAAVGVAAGDFALADTQIVPRRTGKPRFAASAKRSLERAVRVAAARGDRRITSAHLLLGILRAEAGTVPRALAAVGVDRFALAGEAERLLP
jgi:ATP-dependent Clp protease ATP-binding subunit ClpA